MCRGVKMCIVDELYESAIELMFTASIITVLNALTVNIKEIDEYAHELADRADKYVDEIVKITGARRRKVMEYVIEKMNELAKVWSDEF